MSRSKKIFFAGIFIFFVVLVYVSYDISKRTSFPGSKSQLKERLKEKYIEQDSIIQGSTIEDTLSENEKN